MSEPVLLPVPVPVPVPVQPMLLPAQRLELLLLPLSRSQPPRLLRCSATPPTVPHPPAAPERPTRPVPAAWPTTTPRRH